MAEHNDTPPENGQPPERGEESQAPYSIQLLDERLRLVAYIIGVMLIIGGIFTALALAWPAIQLAIQTLVPFVVGFIFAYIFNPVVTFVQKRLRLSRVGGVLFLYLIGLLLLTGFFAMVLPILITQIRGAYVGISSFVAEQIQRSPELLDIWQWLVNWLEERELTPEALLMQAFQTTELREAARAAAASGFLLVGQAIYFFYWVGTWIFGTAMFFIFAILVNIYLLIDFSKVRDVMEVMVPDKHQERTFDILHKVDVAVGGFIRGILIVAFLVGAMTFVALWLLGLREYALIIGVIAGVANIVPYLGPVVGATPAVLYVLTSAQYEGMQERLIMLAAVVAVMTVIQMIESYILQPKIVGAKAQLHPLAVLLAFAVGVNFGILGIIVAVPVACIVRVLLKEFYWDSRANAWEERVRQRKKRKRQKRRYPGEAST